ncbi:unnamed protein product, partial [Allacma fusca]
QTPSGETNEEVAPQDQTSTPNLEEQSEEDPSSTISRLQAKVEKLKESVRKHNERAKELNRQVLELQEQHNLASSENSLEITIGSGVYMQKTVLAKAT